MSPSPHRGDAVAPDHPLGRSRAWLATTPVHGPRRRPDGRYALARMYIGQSQGTGTGLERGER